MAGELGEVLDTIRDYSSPLTVTRDGVETVDVGGYTSVATAAVVGVTGHMQPMSEKELSLLSEGERALEWWNIWTLQEVLLNDTVTDGVAPTVKVLKFMYWNEGPYWKLSGTRVENERGG